MTIKNFSIEYDAINSKNTFTNGDTINGRIIVEVFHETRVKSLTFIAQGEARVRWKGSQSKEVYRSEEKYYDITQNVLREQRQDGAEILGKGKNVFPFSFTIPERKMPSSLELCSGKIVHKLKAELILETRRQTRKVAKTHFTFQSKPDMDFPGLMDPVHGYKDKSVKISGPGGLSVDVHTERIGYKQGEAVHFTIRNDSSWAVKPRFLLYRKLTYSAGGQRTVHINDILKEKHNLVSRSQIFVNSFTIPKLLPPSLTNCSIIQLEYRLKIYLHFRWDTDSGSEFPIIVFPASEHRLRKDPPPSAPSAFEVSRIPNQTLGSSTPPQHTAPRPVDLPPPYEEHAMYPSIPEYRNQTSL